MQLQEKPKTKNQILSALYYALFVIFGLLLILKQPVADAYPPAMIYVLRSMFLTVGVITIYFIKRIGHMLFANENDEWFFCMTIAFMPDFIHTFAYLNTSAITLLAISMILYSWVLLVQTRNDRKNFLILAVGVMLCTMADPQGYGYLVTTIVLFAQLVQIKNTTWKKYFPLLLLFLASLLWNALRFFMLGFSPSAYLPASVGALLKEEAAFVIANANAFHHLLWPNVIFFQILLIVGLILFFIYMTHERSVFNISIQAATKKRHLLETYFGLNVSIVLIYGIVTAFSSTISLMSTYVMPMLIPLMYFISVGFGKFTIHMFRLFPRHRKIIHALVPVLTYLGLALSIIAMLMYLVIAG
ncbi:MAG: hypothetical protein K6G23_05555 [Lachnospiraceae bacterium]|nr:hypothetical protein [Lachnospiraceae bacterium]